MSSTDRLSERDERRRGEPRPCAHDPHRARAPAQEIASDTTDDSVQKRARTGGFDQEVDIEVADGLAQRRSRRSIEHRRIDLALERRGGLGQSVLDVAAQYRGPVVLPVDRASSTELA